MKVTSAEFVGSAASPKGFPRQGLPELAFLGRSNVGKSSLINSLLNRRSLAQTSRTPGKTRTVNFFLINDAFLFADLPGYGYAKVSRSVQQSWEKMVVGYLKGRSVLRGSILLVDLRHPPKDTDRRMKEWLEFNGCPVVVAATKADKLSSLRRKDHLDVIRRELPLAAGTPLIPYSSRTGLGREELWRVLLDLLAHGP